MFPERPLFATRNKHDTNILQNVIVYSRYSRFVLFKIFLQSVSTKKLPQGSSTYFSQDLRPSESAIRHTTFAKETARTEKEVGFVGKYDRWIANKRHYCKNPGNNVANLLASRSPKIRRVNIQIALQTHQVVESFAVPYICQFCIVLS